MSEGTIIAVIGGVSAIIAAIIGGEYALKAQKLSKQSPEPLEESINQPKARRSFTLMKFWLILALVFFIGSLFFVLNNCRRKEPQIFASSWLILENNKPTGGIILEKKGENGVSGFIIDGDLHEYKLEGIMVNDSLNGNLFSSNTSLLGKFAFLFNPDRSKMEGNLELEGGIYNLHAQKAQFNATIANIPSPNKKIGLRNRILTDSELSIINSKRAGYGFINSRTLIGEISIGDSVVFLSTSH